MPHVNRRSFLKTLAASCAVGWSCRSQRSRSNIVFILVDDLGWADLGCYGSTFYETPNIDSFAATATRFTDAYAASPVCSPTRAAIMTGKHPARVGITDWIPGQDPQNRKLLGPQDKHHLPLQEQTLAELLKREGYATFFSGKWHLGDEGYFPEDQGFDINKGGHEKGSPPGGYYVPFKNPKLDDGPEGEYLTDRLTDESIRFIHNHRNKPFFVFLSFYTVHTPIQACKRFVTYFEKKAAKLAQEDSRTKEHEGFTKQNQNRPDYASMIYAMDENVGRMLNSLEELNLKDNTAVIFTSDNGGLATLGANRNAPTANGPLRAGKGWCYEGGIRVPLLVRVPGFPASTINTPVVSHDLFSTVIDLTRAQFPIDPIDGKSLLPLLRGEPWQRNALFWHYPHYHGSTWTPGAAIRKDRWKLIQFYHYNKVELFDLQKDLGEKNDVSQLMPEKVQELSQELSDWQKNINAKMPVHNPNYW